MEDIVICVSGVLLFGLIGVGAVLAWVASREKKEFISEEKE